VVTSAETTLCEGAADAAGRIRGGGDTRAGAQLPGYGGAVQLERLTPG